MLGKGFNSICHQEKPATKIPLYEEGHKANKAEVGRQGSEWVAQNTSWDLTRTKPIFQSFLSTEGLFSGKLTKLSRFCLRRGWR